MVHDALYEVIWSPCLEILRAEFRKMQIVSGNYMQTKESNLNREILQFSLLLP